MVSDAWDWPAEQLDVDETLREDGAIFTFTHIVKGDLDPISGTYPKNEKQTYEVPGILKMYQSTAYYAQRWLPEITVQATDEVLLISCTEYIPELGDLVDLNGEIFTVFAVSVLHPAKTKLLQYILIRKG